MKKIILLFSLVYFGFACLSVLNAGQRKVKNDESIFMGLQKAGLSSLNNSQEKKEFMDVVYLHKQKIQYKMLQTIYENAFEYYRQGNYDEAKALSAKILSIDPNFEDAAMLLDASSQLRGKAKPFLSRRLLMEDRFRTALSLYKKGRIIEAYNKMEQVVKLSPSNIKAKYWLKKIEDDLKDYYFTKGKKAYRGRNLQGALDNYYNALLLQPKDTAILAEIAKTEEELRDSQANEKLKSALEYYAQGKLLSTYGELKKVLEIKPSDTKAAKLLNEVRTEIEKGYIAAGRKHYSKRKYDSAIASWNKAKPYSKSVSYINKLIKRTNDQVKREAREKKRRLEEAARRKKETADRKKREAEERKRNISTPKSGPIVDDGRKKRILQENRIAAQHHYLSGLKYFQNSDYEKAKNEWTIAKQLDPENADAQAGLKRIENILSGG
jgi:tetratricopeptide (TPR) repeat protein